MENFQTPAKERGHIRREMELRDPSGLMTFDAVVDYEWDDGQARVQYVYYGALDIGQWFSKSDFESLEYRIERAFDLEHA